MNGIEAQNPPFEYIDNGAVVGFDIDITHKFAERLGVKAEFLDTAWSGVIPSLYTKKFDMIWSAMTITEPRKEAVSFSKPYANASDLVTGAYGPRGLSTSRARMHSSGRSSTRASTPTARNLPTKLVVIVAASSAHDVAGDLCEAGADVTMVQRLPNTVVRSGDPTAG